jgi:uridine monophosphate synthetase
VITIADILHVLEEQKLITKDQLNAVSRFLSYDTVSRKRKSLRERMEKSQNPLTNQLTELIMKKKSNLILSPDVDTQDRFFSILEQVADEIVMVKTHVDIIRDFSPSFVSRLQSLSEKSGFMIFEDRKFADIGSTVRKQFREGIYRIGDWAEFITVHLLPGPGIMRGLFEGMERSCSAFLLAAMSAEGNLLSENYARQVINIANQFKEHVSGFIGFSESEQGLQRLKNKLPEETLLLTPGVHLESSGDGLGQRYVTVEQAIRGGADAIIVGRGIYAAQNPEQSARAYREKAWNAYIKQSV